MFDGPNPEEGEIIGGVEVPHRGPGLGRQLVDQPCVLHCSCIVQSATNRDAWEQADIQIWVMDLQVMLSDYSVV